jgi:hypothetical protein
MQRRVSTAKNSRAQPLRVRPACRPIALLKAGAALSGMGLAGSARTALNFHRFTPSWPLQRTGEQQNVIAQGVTTCHGSPPARPARLGHTEPGRIGRMSGNGAPSVAPA